MKRTIIILLASALLFSCKDYSYDTWNPDTSLKRTGEVSLLVSFENLETKLTMDDNGHGTWEEGDMIAVACSDGSFVDFTLDGTGDTRRAVFKGTIPDGLQIGNIAVYPAACIVSYDGSIISLSAPSGINNAQNSYKGILVGSIGKTWEVNFRQAMAFLDLTLSNYPVEAGSISLSCAGMPLSGTFTAEVDSVLTRGLKPSDGSGTAGLTIAMSDVSKESYVTVPVPVAEYPILNATFIDAKNDAVLEQALSDYSISLERAELRKMTVTLSDVAAPPCRINLNGNRTKMEETAEGSNIFEATFEVPATGSFTIELDGAPYGYATYSGAGGLGLISANTSALPVDKIKAGGKSKRTYYVKRAQGTMASTDVANNPFTLDLESPGRMHLIVDCTHSNPRYSLNLVEAPDPNVLYHEDFDLCVFGGDYLAPADGRGANAEVYDGWIPCTAARTQNQPPFNFDYPDKVGAALPLQEFIDSYGFADWAFACASERPGAIQLCTGSMPGFMTTPKFSAVSGTADVVIEVETARFSTSSIYPISFKLLGAGKFISGSVVRDAYTSAKNKTSYEQASTSITAFTDEDTSYSALDDEYYPHSIDNADIDKPVSHFRFEATGVTADTRLMIEAPKGATSAPRIFVFDIKVTRK